MKKILSLLLILPLLAGLCACSSGVIIYEEETAIHQWIAQRTEGYTQIAPSSMMYLRKDNSAFTLRIDTGSDTYPRVTVINELKNVTAVDNTMLTVKQGDQLFAQSTHTNRFFDPYSNDYTPTMKVYKKDDYTFRVFFWLYGSNTDFYPIPLLLTAEQFLQAKAQVDAYNQEKYAESADAGDQPFDYSAEFTSLYEAKYFSDKAKNPKGEIYYEYTGAACDNLTVYRNLIRRLGLTEQDWRKSFEDLGYVGQALNLQIVYCDITVGTADISMVLKTSDPFTSQALKAKNPQFTYTFCSSLATYDFIKITQE